MPIQDRSDVAVKGDIAGGKREADENGGEEGASDHVDLLRDLLKYIWNKPLAGLRREGVQGEIRHWIMLFVIRHERQVVLKSYGGDGYIREG